MTSLISRAGLGLAVLLSAGSLLADDAPLPDNSGWAPGGDAVSGMRVGRPYYWTGSGAATIPAGPGEYDSAGFGPADPYGYGPGPVGPGAGCGCRGGAGAAGFNHAYGGPGYTVGGYGAGYGTPFYGNGGYYGVGGDPYTEHFGPGFQRNSTSGHNRFPGYSYRRPWYYPGLPSYNRDTNLPW